MSPEVPDGRFAQRIGGNAAHHHGFVAESGKPDRDIGFGAPDVHVEPSALQQQLPTRCGEPEQELSEADDAGPPTLSVTCHQRASQPPSTARIWPCT